MILAFTGQNRGSIEASDFVCLDAGSAVFLIPNSLVWKSALIIVLQLDK